jgi:glycerol-3-phosphate dehydrogenase
LTVRVSSPLRDAHLARLETETHDVLVIGAGINGAVSALATAGQGGRVALIDRADFGGFTSQESSNLVWGGIKYLEGGEFGLVWGLCGARNELLRSYPSQIQEVRFLAALERGTKGFRRTRGALWAGTWLYWLMGRGFTRTPHLVGPASLKRREPVVRAEIMKGGVEYSDGILLENDARFVWRLVQRAGDEGAVTANYAESLGSVRAADGVWTTQVRDQVSGRRLTVRSRTLVNAGGPFVDPINARDGVDTRCRHVLSKGIHLVVERVTESSGVLAFFDPAGRLFFIIPMGHRSVIGTTDQRVDDPDVRVTDEDREWVLEQVNRRLHLPRPLRPSDVIAERCGVRPLAVDRGEGTNDVDWLHLSRRHRIEVDRATGRISIFGGKLTDCLHVGREVSQALGALGVPLPLRGTRWWGEPGADVRARFLDLARRVTPHPPTDHEPLGTRLWRRYGQDGFSILDALEGDPRGAEPVLPGLDLRWCEVHHAAEREFIVTLEDFLRRRTRLALMERRGVLSEDPVLRRVAQVLFESRGPSS